MKAFLARTYIELATSHADRIFFVYGMRRSGNHACIGWLVNALEHRMVRFVENDDVRNFNYSDSGRTCFINDVSTIEGRKYLSAIHRERKKIKQAQFEVISAEDKDSRYSKQWRIPRRSEVILVRRQALNLIASRFQNLNRRAQQGIGMSLQTMDAQFFSTLNNNLQSPQGTVWEFERWHSDPAWRANFLAQLHLTQDIMPASVGLGSSFTKDRGLASIDQLNQRFSMVEPRRAWLQFIQDVTSQYPRAFSPAEHERVRAMVEQSVSDLPPPAVPSDSR